ncbi:hypothetical protein CRUP_035345 [Coryphaenoides rupestris]|nr:hypothetical protein CRUP_035345 [Coryphaenoides rupestris]
MGMTHMPLPSRLRPAPPLYGAVLCVSLGEGTNPMKTRDEDEEEGRGRRRRRRSSDGKDDVRMVSDLTAALSFHCMGFQKDKDPFESAHVPVELQATMRSPASASRSNACSRKLYLSVSPNTSFTREILPHTVMRATRRNRASLWKSRPMVYPVPDRRTPAGPPGVGLTAEPSSTTATSPPQGLDPPGPPCRRAESSRSWKKSASLRRRPLSAKESGSTKSWSRRTPSRSKKKRPPASRSARRGAEDTATREKVFHSRESGTAVRVSRRVVYIWPPTFSSTISGKEEEEVEEEVEEGTWLSLSAISDRRWSPGGAQVVSRGSSGDSPGPQQHTGPQPVPAGPSWLHWLRSERSTGGILHNILNIRETLDDPEVSGQVTESSNISVPGKSTWRQWIA